MIFAVGAYSGGRPACGAVAQLAKNARHVTAAITRMDSLAFSSLIDVGLFRRFAIIARKCSNAANFI
jgi:hypothetical protein